MRNSDVRDGILQQNNEPIPALNIATNTTAASTALPIGDLDGNGMYPPSGGGSSCHGPDLLLQADQDVYVRFATSATPPLGQVTGPTGANPGFLVKAGQTLAVCPRASVRFISTKAVTTNGNLTIFNVQ